MALTRLFLLCLALNAVHAAFVQPVHPLRAEFFPRAEVRLLDGPFLDAQRRDSAYLLQLDPDRLLHTFRRNAGLPTSAQPLGGWEAPEVELRGHTLGHYLTACALMFEATGDERLRQRAVELVAELARVQQALERRGSNPGYVSAFPETFFDRVEKRENVWAPYYTLHKILAGVLDVHRVTDDPTALGIARGMANWVDLRASRLNEAQWQAQLETEFGGMQEALTELYRRTGDDRHLRLARLFDHRAVFDPLARGEDRLDGLHANTQIPKAIGAALDCELTGETRYCEVARQFWDLVALHRSYVVGGHSEYEHFSPTRRFSRYLGVNTAETCNTYNMLKLTRLLFQQDAKPSRLDFYERALMNHILASQDPVTGMVIYHLSLKPGAWRTYATPNDSFWCCVGTGIENPARFGEAIYARQGEALLVNLFMASELTWREKGLTLRQETRFPEEPRTRLLLRLTEPRRFALQVRHPSWAEGPLKVSVNGEPVTDTSRAGTFASLEREWRDGDRVEVEVPMSLRIEAMPDDRAVVAFLYGPVVLAADLGTRGLDASRRYGAQAPEMKAEEMPTIPVLVADNAAEALKHVQSGGEPLAFRTAGLGRPADVELRPLYRLHDRRYTVYFDLLDAAALSRREALAVKEAQALAALDARTIDRVTPGDPNDEAAHALEQKNSEAGRFEGRLRRFAFWGNGEFSYQLKVPPARPVFLGLACWGGESRRHTYQVVVDGVVIATQTLFDDDPGNVVRVEIPIPTRLTEGRERVRVGFRAADNAGSIGAIFDVRTLKPAGSTD
jgi:DUF1680 family protein